MYLNHIETCYHYSTSCSSTGSHSCTPFTDLVALFYEAVEPVQGETYLEKGSSRGDVFKLVNASGFHPGSLSF